MYSIAAAVAPGGNELWAAFSALRLLDEAADLLAGAEVEAARLAAESTWSNDGISPRKLRAALDELHQLVGREGAVVRERRARVRQVLGT